MNVLLVLNVQLLAAVWMGRKPLTPCFHQPRERTPATVPASYVASPTVSCGGSRRSCQWSCQRHASVLVISIGVIRIRRFLAGGNSNILGIFTPKIGEMIQFDEQIFQMG